MNEVFGITNLGLSTKNSRDDSKSLFKESKLLDFEEEGDGNVPLWTKDE